ncbi:hypothetical protein HPT27_09965 [Permianibacter sp. IMCC34836]|uniref:SoxR reducing system RseC family protein n=1 Tax=Permianibacter fluminis TaxID=2738515 RepID=UPI00155278A8|nr:hypothetical protein [Permianibacter fluminis]
MQLRPLQRADCPRCAAGNGCGAQLFSAKTNSTATLSVATSEDCVVACGDVVVVGMQPQLLQRAALWLYGVPLLVMLLTVALAAAASLPESVQVLLTALVLVASFWLVRQRLSRLTRQPVLTLLRREVLDSPCSDNARSAAASPPGDR